MTSKVGWWRWSDHDLTVMRGHKDLLQIFPRQQTRLVMADDREEMWPKEVQEQLLKARKMDGERMGESKKGIVFMGYLYPSPFGVSDLIWRQFGCQKGNLERVELVLTRSHRSCRFCPLPTICDKAWRLTGLFLWGKKVTTKVVSIDNDWGLWWYHFSIF